jgi:hypothetical protein
MVQLTWGLGLGGQLLILAGLVLIIAGILEIAAHTTFFFERIMEEPEKKKHIKLVDLPSEEESQVQPPDEEPKE